MSFNNSGSPAVVIPFSSSKNGLPIGVQIVSSLLVLLVIIYLLIKSNSMSYTVLDSGTNFDLSQNCCFLVVAEWCGHCKNLKESGELEKLNKNLNVVMIQSDHPKADEFMSKVDSKGYPTIALCKAGKLYKYEGNRNSEDIFRYFTKL